MKFAKCLTFLTVLTGLSYLSFRITYDNVSAIVMKELEESKKNEIVIKPIILQEEKEEPKLELDNKETLNVKTDNFIFVGDSRLDSIDGLSKKVGFNSVKFITTDNPDYYWIVNDGIHRLNNVLENNPGSYNIVFNLGIRDLNNSKMYIDFFNSLANRYPNQNIFVLSIGPISEKQVLEDGSIEEDSLVEEDKSTGINNDDIYNFNVDMMKALDDNIHMIHVFQELMNNGYNTVGDYYFTKDTSISLFKFIYKSVKDLQKYN